MIFFGSDNQMMERDKTLKALGAHIAKVRNSKGYSQDRVYLEAGFSRGTMSKIESGKVNPRFLTLKSIAETIGVPLRRIIEFKVE
jgi:DNA-binding XRE family transcriptional regulator